MGAVKEQFINNVRYADKSNTIDLFEFPDEPLSDEELVGMAEYFADCEAGR